MSIARRAILGLAVALLIAGVASRLPASNDAPRERLEAELKVVRTTIENGSVEIEAKVLVRNHFEGALRNVTAVVDTAINMDITPRQVAVGEVPRCGSAIASQHVTLRYEAPGQGSPNVSRKITWKFEYAEPESDAGDALCAPGMASERKSSEGAPEPKVSISEIMVAPSGSTSGYEWIELRNDGSRAISVAGYWLETGVAKVFVVPESLPSIPPGGILLIKFDGQNAASDDKSFEADGTATLHAPAQEAFADDGDVCALFKPLPSGGAVMQSLVAWGGSRTRNAQVYSGQAGRLGLWDVSAAKVSLGHGDLEGPVPVLSPGGSMVLRHGEFGSRGLLAVPCLPDEATPGRANKVPAPQLHLPRHDLRTSANLFTFSWISVGNAEYELQISSQRDFATLEVHATGLKAPRFRPEAGLARSQVHYWRVRASDATGTSGWSEIRSVAIDAVGDTEGDATERLQPNPLGVPNRAARKDSALLCLDACDAAHWDSSNLGQPQHAHSTWYCWAAASQMMSWYRGGSMLQDEVVAFVKGGLDSPVQPDPQLPHGIAPKDSLPHGAHAGASQAEGRAALRYALQAVDADLNVTSTKPSAAQLRSYIDGGRPLRYSTGGHAMVVDGYRTVNNTFQARFLNTDNDGTIEWRSWADEPFAWCAVPNAGLTGRVQDVRLSQDSDGDGMTDFDEDDRFPTRTGYPDSDWDGVGDKADVRSYALRGFSEDVDLDGNRGEVDADSDDGGLQDGLEDLDHDGVYEPAEGETDPHAAADDVRDKIDLVLAIDTTSSMVDDIGAAKLAAIDIVDSIDAESDDFRVAVISFEDFPYDPYGNPACGDYMYHDVLNFSADRDTIVGAIQSLSLRCGADWPEAHYSALMHSLQKTALGGWRDGVAKVVILMSDAPPHDPEPETGYVAADVVDASIALDPAVIYPILIGGDPAARVYFEALADGTGGTLLEAADATQVVDALMEAIAAAFDAPVAVAGGPYVVCPGTAVLFDGSGSFDRDGIVTFFEWDFDDDGVYDFGSAAPTALHTYAGSYSGVARLRVSDDAGLRGVALAAVEASDDEQPYGWITSPGPDACVGAPVTIVDNFVDNCDAALTRTYEPGPGPTYFGHGNHTVTVTATDASGNSAVDSVAFTIDLIPPTVTLTDATRFIVPRGPVPASLYFTSNDTDGAKGGVTYEAVSLEDCVLLEGYGAGDSDGDGLISDEDLTVTTSEFCALAAKCGFTTLVDPTWAVEATDCGSNVGIATRTFQGSVKIKPGICGM